MFKLGVIESTSLWSSPILLEPEVKYAAHTFMILSYLAIFSCDLGKLFG